MNPIQRFEQRFAVGAGLEPAPTMHIPRRVQAIQVLSQWKNAGDEWLRMEIGTAFQQLVCLALPGTPAVEMLPATAEMWLLIMADMDLTEEVDRPRIARAFKLLYTHIKMWPQLSDLIANLPPRPQKAQAQRERTEAQQADGAARLQNILDGLGKEGEDEPQP